MCVCACPYAVRNISLYLMAWLWLMTLHWPILQLNPCLPVNKPLDPGGVPCLCTALPMFPAVFVWSTTDHLSKLAPVSAGWTPQSAPSPPNPWRCRVTPMVERMNPEDFSTSIGDFFPLALVHFPLALVIFPLALVHFFRCGSCCAVDKCCPCSCLLYRPYII